MSASRLRKRLLCLQAGIFLALFSLSAAQTDPCQPPQPCANGGLCRRAYLTPGYICECFGDWHGQNCRERFPGTTSTQPKECGTNFFADSGTVESPNFPQPADHNQDCFYLIRVPSALSITLTFDVFVTETAKDQLFIVPGTTLNLNSPNLREFNGSRPIPDQTFNTNQLVMYWTTDFNIFSPGFSISYRIDPDPCWDNPCLNGGSCTTLGRDYSCACPPDFRGDNCEIGTVIVSRTTISLSVGNPVAEGRVNHALTFDLSFSPGATQFSLTGTGLWSVTLFLRDDANNRWATQVVSLTSQQSSVEWRPPATSTIRTIQTTVNLNTFSCPQMLSVCAVIGQGLNPSSPFSLRGTPTNDSLIDCTPVQCRGVEVTSLTFDGPLRTLREGVNSQNLQFSLTMSTNTQAGTVTGSNLWKIMLFGNTQVNGQGPSVLSTQLALTAAQAGASVEQNGNVRFFSLEATLNLDGIVCPQVRYLCVKVERGDNPSPQFTLTGAVLTVCQATTCRGVQITDTSVSITSGTPFIERRVNPVTFSLSIQSNANGGNVNGQNLFTIQTFASNSLTGTSIRISERQVQGNVAITAGRLATMPGLSTTIDLSGRLCQQIVALCTELDKGPQANPDFTLEPIPNNAVLEQCVNIECRGVYVQSLNIVLTSSSQIFYGNRNQVLSFNLEVRADTQSANIAGARLWRLLVYANNQLDGMGTRRGQVAATLTTGQQATSVSAGQLVNFNNIQVTLDLSSVTSCANINYLCVELQKGLSPSPDFTLQGSTTRCILVQCAMFNPCGSNPCQNGGTCNNAAGSFTCTCAPGWAGPLCSLAVNACSGIFCRNGGTCIDRQFSYECQCQLGWMGDLCQDVNPGVVITTTGLGVTTGTIRENNAQNSLTVSVTLTNSQSGSSLAPGSGYWQITFFTSQQADSQGLRSNQQTLNLNVFQSGLGITAGGSQTFSNLPVTLNLQGQACSRVPYVCVEVRKGTNPSPNFLLSGSLIACQESNCRGVQVIQVSRTINSGQTLLLGESSHTINMDITVRSSAAGASISGTNLWSVVVFTDTLQSGLGITILQQNAILTSQAVSLDLTAGSFITLRGATVTYDLSGLTSCRQLSFLCVRLEENPLASPDFTLSGFPDATVLTNCLQVACEEPSPCDSHNCQNGGLCQETGQTTYSCNCPNGWTGDFCTLRVNACQGIICANGGTCINRQFSYECQCTLEWQGTNCQQPNPGVIITIIQIIFSNVFFREGTSSNNINFNVVISSDASGQSISGTGLWQFNIFGSSQADGSGPRYGLNSAVYNPASQLNAGGTVTINGVQVTLDFSQVLCSQVPYICVEVLPGAAASPPFVLTGDRVACAPISCVGVQITGTQLRVVSSSDVKEREVDNSLILDLTITTSANGGAVSGSRLWQVTAFLSDRSDGFGEIYAPIPIQLSEAQAGLSLQAGFSAVMSALQTNANTALNGLVCGQFGYICVRLEKSPSSSVDFTLGDGTQSQSYVACAPVNCRGVEVTNVIATIVRGEPVNTETTTNNVVFDVRVTSNANGASISGTDLWQVIVFSDTRLDGQGQTVIQVQATLPGNAANIFLNAGVDMILRSVQVNLDLTRISCNQIPYICVRFLKGSNPTPDFTLTPVPSDDVLLHCQPIECMEPSPCDSHNCQNGGVCQETGQTTYICNCPNGWTGDFCTLSVNACQGIICANGGTCISRQFSYECQCTLQWQGTNCQQPNQGVIITIIQIIFSNVFFREGTSSNNINFNVVISSDASGQSISGTGLWQFNIFGSSQADGSGPRYGLNNAVYNPASQLTAGGTVTINGVQVTLDFSQVLCSQVPYICVEVLPGASASPPFVLTGDRVACAPIDCVGVQIIDTQLRVVSSSDVKERDITNPLTLDLTITTSATGGAVSGSRLWQVTAFLSAQPDGSGVAYAPISIQLSDAQTGLSLQAGVSRVMSALQTNANTALDGLVCGQFGYICVRLERSPSASIDFILGDGTQSQSYVACAPVNCRGVEVTDVNASIISGEPVNTETTINNVVFDVRVTSNANGASISGNNLWQVIVFSDTQLDGQGQTVIQAQATLPGNAANIFLNAGVDMILRSVQVNLDLTRISCNQIPYICVQFQKGPSPTPDFTLMPVPSDDVLLHCQPIECMDPSACLNHACENGVCEHLGPDSYRCICTPGWIGLFCNTVGDYCLTMQSPCLNGGQCISLSDDYQCICPPTWVGRQCQTDNPCIPTNPCLSGGTCFPNQFGDYTCSCVNGYTGNNCEIAPDPCLTHQCQNGGRCERIGTGSAYTCACRTGYVGSLCEIPLDPCESSPCINGGTCSQVGMTYVYECSCPDDYTGTNCEIRIDPCAINPCLNGGVCNRRGATGYQCACSLGFGGTNCENTLDPCASNPCQNGGTCSRVGASFVYQCQCPPNFSGTNCQTPNPCASNPCQNGGTCSRVGVSFVYQCQCPPNFSGTNCQTPNPCISNPCRNGGTCIQAGSGYNCQCPAAYTGVTCATPLNPCVSSPCLNGATCIQLGTNFQCQCAPGYTGNNCGTTQNPCNTNPCFNGGKCSWFGQPLVYQCQCLDGYGGDNCQIITNPCVSSPCLNGATCSQLGTDFRCQCAPGYTGTNCGTIQNPCNTNPCFNGGTCSWFGQALVYQCRCLDGYGGDNCQIITNPCVSSPCLNGATCSQLGTDFQCQCAPGYTGTNCGTIQNPCNNNPCVNGGTCSWSGQALVYQCQCLAGYGGDNCQIVTNPCVSSPCLNGATCSQLGTDFQCQCAPGYTGTNCGTIQNPCNTNPCFNGGTCSWFGQALVYQCQCLDGYGGDNCQIITNPCVSSPCLNGATCSQLGTNFQCQCAPGYTGANCGTIQNPCNNNPCVNGGTCSWSGQALVYQCQCLAGYGGNNCQIVLDPCAPNPCVNGGACSWFGLPSVYQCQCLAGYGGDNCQTVLNPCDNSPCRNGGTCSWPGQPLIYQCRCLTGYSGNNCQIVQNPCNSNPCQNNGFCQWLGTSFTYTCQCPLGFTGLNCQNALNPCVSFPCINGGTCTWQTPNYRYTCQCRAEYTGINCEIGLGPCFSNPCINGGTCYNQNQDVSYFCGCPSDFMGDNCQYPAPCASSPCLNGGTCSSDAVGSFYRCSCLANFQGSRCQFPNPCSSQPCLNGGVCAPDNTGSFYLCSCVPNYFGNHCQFLTPCISNPCFNGGQCETDNVGSMYTCNCLMGFIGDQCLLDDPCLPNPCLNGAACALANGGQTYDCSCLNGFFGINCHIQDPCTSFPCINGGVCTPASGGLSFTCTCQPQFLGNNCQYPNPCSSFPCQNGGACEPHPQGISFICFCPPEFLGDFCQSRNPCVSNPCLNGGVCQLGIDGNSFSCTCPTQYLGNRCENLDPCLSGPCQNGGTCTSSAQGLFYFCTCPPRYFGLNCEIQDPCINNPCLNGGACNLSPRGFTCICAPGFTGATCGTRDPCGSQPCRNGGSCSVQENPRGFDCSCTPNFLGDTCEILDLCSYDPCLNGGTCSHTPSRMDFRCDCPLGYSGLRCEEFNPCGSQPCRNGGSCSVQENPRGFDCSCTPNFLGDTCEILDPCSSNPCLNGICNRDDLGTLYTCVCTFGYNGPNCEFASACNSSPCQNDGTCTNEGTSFICTCAQGWMGVTCSQVVPTSNDPPSFLHNLITINIREDTLAGTQVFLLDASDPDSDTLTFGLVDSVALELFIIMPNGPKSAYLVLKDQLDREVQGTFDFTVSVTDDGGNQAVQAGTLLLTDVNDNAPTFTNLPNTTAVFENANINYVVYVVAATDPDSGPGGFVTYTISEGSDAPFSINLYSGEIMSTGELDYETTQVYNLEITATDQATNSLSTTSTLTIQVLDVQDTGPVFINTPYDRSINEGTPLNTVVVTVMAEDQDTVNANDIIYSILAGNQGSFFSLDSVSGAITVMRELDRESPSTPAQVVFTVRARETGPNGGTSAINTFTITINDIDDEPPVFDQSTYIVSISESENPGFVLPVDIEVNDGEVMIQGNFRITLLDSNVVPFSVSPSSAVDQATVTLTLIRPLDFEVTQSYDLQLIAEDTVTTTAMVVVTVTDANDNDPIFTHGTQTIALEEGSPTNTVVTMVTVTDADQGINTNTVFSIIDGNQENLFAINPSSGVITTTANIDYENSARTYTLTVEARNTEPAVAPADGFSVVTVIVSITDINDSPPVFQQPNYYIQIIELSDTGLTIGRVIAEDADSGAAGEVTYSIVSGNEDGTFSVNPNNGNIVLLRPLDRETVALYNITIRAQDNAAPPLSTTTYVVIEVRDFNDNDPQWVSDQYMASVVEGLPADTFVVEVMARDADLGLNALLRYELATISPYLYIDQTSGRIYTREPLDREETESIEVNVIVRDSGNPERFSSQLAVVTVTVLDINDTPPTFTGTPFIFSVEENQQTGALVGQVTAEDPDTIGTLTYSFVTPQTQFLIEPATGRITTINALDREQRGQYEFEVRVTDGTFEATADVTVIVTDVNDNTPVFTQPMYQVTVIENTLVGTILTLMASDSDIDLNSDIIYQFDLSSGPIGPFILDRVTGELQTTTPLDREAEDSYTLIVYARDRQGGDGSLQGVATVLVTVTDVNDNRPIFERQSYTASVAEDAAEGDEIEKVTATDRDIGDNAVILYRIIQGNENDNFRIDPISGTITRGPTPLDRETRDLYVLTVEAYNDGDLPPRNTATVTITVTDVNDEVPRFTQDVYLKPDLLENAGAGTEVITVSANDPDLGEGGQITYSISDGNEGGHFIIDSFTGEITVLGSLPDFDIQSSYNLTVTATDQAQPYHTSQARVMVLLVDAQDDPPEFTMARYEVTLKENVGEGFPFLQVVAEVPGKPASIVTYSLEPNVNPSILQLFEVDPVTGWLTTKGPIDYETGLTLYTFTVLGINGELSGSAAVWVDIMDLNDNAPVFVTFPTEDVIVNENMDAGFVLATLVATDVDSGLNGQVVYQITGGNEDGHFNVITDNGEALLVTTAPLDRETVDRYALTITASDQGIPVMNSSIVVDVVINDLNDNPPTFVQGTYNASVEENVLVNAPIINVVIADSDDPASNNIEFQIDPASNPNGIFQINSMGEITITAPLDRETQAFYDLLVIMTDSGFSSTFMDTTHVYVTVLDQNDNPPVFPDQPAVIVTEGPSSTGMIFVTVTADDADIGSNSDIIYTITGGNGNGIFGIHSNNGSIYVIDELDWETTQTYELIITATDQAMNVNDRRSGTVTVVINVEDINDTPPQFPLGYFGPYSFSEGVPGTYIGTFVAVDLDSGLGGQVTYTITGNFSDLFVINPTTGVLTLKPNAQLDYETSQAFNITIVATDGGSPSFSGTTTVGIVVVNINDNSPRFQNTPYRTGINDTTPVDTWVYQVVATDDDIGPDGVVTYSIFNGNTGGVFRIDPMTGDVYVNKTLTNGVYVLVIKARDNPENPANAREVTETLTILVADSTDVLPIFPDNGTFRGSVQEHSIIGTPVMTISVENADDLGDLIYTISGADAAPFFIDPTTGELLVNGLLDAETKDLYVFNVAAIDSRGVSADGIVYVTILNINDHPPQLDETVFNFTVPEDAGNGYYVGEVSASDMDNTNTILRYTIERGSEDKFTINPATGVITVSLTCRGDICDDQPLDREIQDLYTLTVAVGDQGSPPLSNSGVVYIYVTDVNDFQPYFPNDLLNAVVDVSEDAGLDHTVTTVEAIDQDLSASLTYSIVSVTATTLDGSAVTNISNIEGWFSINPDTGTIYVSQALDRETAAEVILEVAVTDESSVDPALSTSDPNAMVTIRIIDVNDNAPIFQPPGTTFIHVTIQEESGEGTIITNVEAIDPDNPINGMVTYVLIGNLSEYVYIHPITGQITVNQIIDRELYDWLNFTIIATDGGAPSLSTSIPIYIEIIDVNDHNPIFDQMDYTATVTENSGQGTFVIITTATDQDIDQYGEVTYTLIGGNGLFTINSTTGVITTLQPLDRETQSVYTLTVIAIDNPGGSTTNRRQGTATVTVTVGDVNEHPPTTQPNFPFGIPEGQPGGTLVGVIDASDPDNPMQELNFTFILVEPPGGDGLFYINQTTGQIFTTVPLEADNATYGNIFNITILISDNGNPPQTTTTTTIITIEDINDNDPLFPNGPYIITTSEATPVGFEIITVTAEDIDQNADLTYDIIGGNENGTFFISRMTGEILIIKPLDFETRRQYNLTVLVDDQGGRTGTTYVVIHVRDANDQGPVFLDPPYTFKVYENIDIGTEVGQVEAVDADPDPANSQLTYHILSATPAFRINSTTGVIYSNGPLDRETRNSYILTVEVRNVRMVPNEPEVTYKISTPVTITILDLNDNTPTFTGGDNITRSFPENSEVDFPIYQPFAEDLDIGENGRVTYSIVSGNTENTFSIDPETGAIILARQIQTLMVPTYSFTLVVEARDNGDPALYSNITLNALVGDYNDNPPQFVYPGHTLYLPENEPIGYFIAHVLATDIDSGPNGEVTYGFLNEESALLFYFVQGNTNASLYANFTADRETRDRYSLVLLASDGGTPQPLQTPLEVTVVITDKNDNEPFFERVEDNVAIVQILNITEHSKVNTSFGFVTTAFDRDLHPNNIVYYYIVGGNDMGLFSINRTTGEIIVIGDLDRETIATHSLIIKATNNASYVPSGSYDITTDVSLKEVQVRVVDINDNRPRFTTVLYTAGIPVDAEVNTEIVCVKATDLDIGGSSRIVYGIQSATFVLGDEQKAFDDIFYIEENSGCIRTKNTLNGITAGGYFDLSVTATDVAAGLRDTALVRVFVLDSNQQVVVVVNSDIQLVRKQQDELVAIIENITGGIVNIDSITYFIDGNGNEVRDRTMITLHVIDPNTNKLIDADVVLRLIDLNRQSIKLLFQGYKVIDIYPLMSGVGGAGFGIIEAALLAIALLLFLGALIFIIILCCLQRKYLKRIHGNSNPVIYATRSDADVKETATYQGSNPLWLETEGGVPDDWPDSISLLGGGAGREYESQEASMDFFSDIQTEIARDAVVMTAMVSDGQSGSTRSKIVANGGVTSNGRVSSGSDKGQLRVVSSTAPLIMDSTNSDGSVSTLTNRLNRDGSVTANLTSKEGGYSGSSASYSYSSAAFSGDVGASTSGSHKLTSEKAHEIRQMLEEDSYLEDDAYRASEGMAAARAIYREQVEFDNQLSPITEEDTASSWSSWTRDSERSGARYAGGGTLDRNRTTGRSGKDYADPMNNFTTSTSIEESYSHSIKSPSKTESSSYSRRANSKTYSAGVATSIGMVTLTEETPEMLEDEDEESETSLSADGGGGRTYTYNLMGDSSEGAHSLSGNSSGQGFSRRGEEMGLMEFNHEGDDAEEIVEERQVKRSVKTTRGYSNQGYEDFIGEESRL